MTEHPNHGAARPVARAVTVDLLSRFDRPGPRYTSYPTAVEFAETVTPAVYEERLAAADALGDAPLSVYIHLPFCEHRCLFCGCHVIISPDKERVGSYLDHLKREIDMVAARLPHRRKVAQLHLGGGTPTYHRPDELRALIEHFLGHFQPLPGAEFAVEVDPRVTTFEHLDVLRSLGFNRVSMGVQDFTPVVQEAVERIQTREQTRALIEHARATGYTGTNVDLIYGLPMQTAEGFEQTIEDVIGMGVDRTAVYSFAFVPWIRGHQKKLDTDDLPSAPEKANLFALARERFLEHGYEPIGMDHFALPDDELARAKHEGRLRRNFQGYTVIPAEDVIGFGISAIGDVRGAYVQNLKKLSQYEHVVRENVLPVERGIVRTSDDDIRRYVIHQLMCNFHVEPPDVEREFGVDFATYFAEDLERLKEPAGQGLVTVTPEMIRATPVGELFIRNVAMCFDRYWREKHEGADKPVFSKTV